MSQHNSKIKKRSLGIAPIVAAIASDPKMREEGKTIIVNAAKTGITITKVVTISAISLVGVAFIRKGIMKYRAKKFLDEAASDANVQIAMKIYAEIPDKYTTHLSIWDPISPFTTLWANIKGSVTSVDTDIVFAEASKITDFDKVEKAFKIIYNLDFLTVMHDALNQEDYIEFAKRAKEDHTAYQTTSAADAGYYVVPKSSTTVYRRGLVKDTTKPKNFKIVLGSIAVDRNTYLGISTGNKYYDKGTKQYLYETKLKGTTHSYDIYILVEKAKLLTKAEYQAKTNLKGLSITFFKDELWID